MLDALNHRVIVSNSSYDINNSTHLILPGVGSFGACMSKIQNRLPMETLENNVFNQRKPILGICVGMQVLADSGEEFGSHKGLGWIPGKVEKLSSKKLPLPHVGWNNFIMVKSENILRNITEDFDFYYTHSFIFKTENTAHTIAKTEYGAEFSSVIKHQNIYGVQFHPEKSQQAGKILFNNFMELGN